jgi:hypothetical protein
MPLLVANRSTGSSKDGDSLRARMAFRISFSSPIGFSVGYSDLARFSTVGNLRIQKEKEIEQVK